MGRPKQNLPKEELRRKNLYALKLFGQKTACFVERLGYLDIYNKDGHQASLKQDLFQLEMEVLSKSGWETIFNTSDFSKATVEHFLERPFASEKVFQKMSLRSNSYALTSVQNPGLSQWCHSYLSHLPFSPWYCSHFREPALLDEEGYREKVYHNIQTQTYPLHAPRFYGVGYEKSDGTADGYFFFGRKALVSKTQEELLRPLDSIMRVETEEDRNPYKYHYFLESFMKNKLLEDEKYLEEEKRVSAFRILRNKLQKEKEHGYIHPFPGYVENEGERTIIDLNNYRLHVPWHDKLRGAASYGLYRNIGGSFQMTQLGIFPHKLLQFKGYLANRTVDLDRGPDLLCRLSGKSSPEIRL